MKKIKKENSDNSFSGNDSRKTSKPCIRWWDCVLMEVENYCGVLEYDTDYIRLYSSIGIIKIEGKNLNICLADHESIIISGEIIGIFYENPQKV